ncbi:cupin domain-containing protein [Conexibacter stalactiti]|uniref:Cupin domain-containing protein n=1 Tax=Conexibacter stalactiti TaxID=1940611 RepID=A0ABU4HIC2_9ACTN|nr:cupin domain-containing protein [Conexibacter stalactiti]MDW5593064.1 cupin domain-containing protein [Conexibacter stalactiti]MEC5033705.1 cupin domain-containing protein [Conexibacter stalactiti]
MVDDPLSDALALVDARCVVSGAFSAAGTWALRFAAESRLKLTAAVRGSCWVIVDAAGEPVFLRAGDVAVINRHDRLVLASDREPRTTPREAHPLFVRAGRSMLRLGAAEESVIVGAHVDVDHGGDDLLLASLPAVTKIGTDQPEAPVIAWLLDRLLSETIAGRPGAVFATRQHAQLLFVEVLRACLREPAAFPNGWLRALSDPASRQRFAACTATPPDDGTSKTWPRPAGCRARRSKRASRRPRVFAPMAYLHAWRIRLAQRALRDDDVPIATLTTMLGYGSDSAFSTAFKRTVGVAPRHDREATTDRSA